ncbi:MAG: inositol-3-phosphate synthase [Candidatus Micrarchaeota archaeon]|nr:inositol-3-phosphate synthase [Candidatus Micrarchaeota archaeon]
MRFENRKKDYRLGVMLVGLGAVSTTFIAGTFISRKKSKPYFGSLTQEQTIRIGKREENKFIKIKDFVDLADPKQLIFAAWDPIADDAYAAAKKAGVLNDKDLNSVRKELKEIRPMKAVFDRNYVRNLDGPNKKRYKSKMDAAKMLIEDILNFKEKKKCNNVVMINCASTESYIESSDKHAFLDRFEKALAKNSEEISPAMIYAYSAIKAGIPYANGAPSLAADIPSLVSLSKQMMVPIAGKDFKTGQTFMKTVIAPALKARMLGLRGWFSTNILGNRDGEVLADPSSFRTKEKSKLSVLNSILQPQLYPHLYGDYHHQVHINYYKPRGDDKEGWDNIDIFGWLGYPMQIKVNFLCKDSILAAPIVLDLVLFLDFAKRHGLYGVQDWLSFYFKSPMTDGKPVEHDFFIQHMKLKNTLRKIKKEKPITHLE